MKNKQYNVEDVIYGLRIVSKVLSNYLEEDKED